MYCPAIAFVLLLAASVPAFAGWEIRSGWDRLSDKEVKSASLDAKESDNGVSAVLHLVCAKGKRIFGLRASRDFGKSNGSSTYRIDDHPSRDGGFDLTDPWTIVFGPAVDLINARRFRVVLRSAEQPQLFYDFDLTGIAAANRAIGCG